MNEGEFLIRHTIQVRILLPLRKVFHFGIKPFEIAPTVSNKNVSQVAELVDAKLEGGCRFESCCVYLDEKHIASTAERSLINYYRFESCPDYS